MAIATLGARLGTLGTGRAAQAATAVKRPNARERGYSWAWQKARKAFLSEPGNALCRPCLPRVTAAAEVDHVIPHRGDPDLFWDRANWQPICVPCHLAKTKAEQSQPGRLAGEDITHPPGLRPARMPLTIVCGPPASGKSTYVRDRAAPADLVIDLDVLKSELSGLPLHSWDSAYLRPAILRRNELLNQLGDQPPPWPRAWLIIGEPWAHWREWWARALRPERIVVLETPDMVCLARIVQARDRAATKAQQSEAVMRWWNNYRPRPGEDRLTS